MDAAPYGAMIEQALLEDLGPNGDVTSEAIFSDEPGETLLLSKDTGVLAGADLFSAVFKHVDSRTQVTFFFKDGELLEPGVTVATIRGFARSVLTAERVALNFLSFLSGIATATRLFVETAGKHGTARILDTRKTLPGYRELSKYAVRMGGGTNHRRGLYDMVLIKDNHIDQAGSITVAVERVRAKWGDRFRVEVECRSLEEVREAIGTGVDVIMLDNMDKATIQEAVALKKSKIKFEVSGNMDLDSVEALSSTGIDFISIGRITHSVRSFDFSMKTRRTD